VFGIAQVDETLQAFRGGIWPFVKSGLFRSKEPPYKTPFITTVPTLAEMTLAALNILDNDPDGFFLMVEGAGTDVSSEANHLGRMIEERNDFNEAIQAVIVWVETFSNWEETLVIVTSDHEAGYLWGPGSRRKTFNPIIDNGPGKMPGYKYYSWGHSNLLVPLFVKGIGSDRFQSYATNVDVKMGPYIDNTNIAHLIFGLYDELNE
jgi:alkaline phosphatase